MDEEIFGRLLFHDDFPEGDCWRRRHYTAGEVIFREGDSGREVYLVLGGRVEVSSQIQLDGNRHVQPGFWGLGKGGVFGELAMFDDGPRSATVVTLSDCELAVLNGERLLAFLEQHPDIGFPLLLEFIRLLVGRLRSTNKKMVSLFAWGLKVHEIDRHL